MGWPKRKRFLIPSIFIAGILIPIFFLTIKQPKVTKLGAGGERCPFGHNDIEAIPQEYSYDSDQFSPAYLGSCRKCGAEYSPREQFWGHESSKLTALPFAFSWPIAGFPLPKDAKTSYTQIIYKGKLLAELMWFEMTCSPDELTAFNDKIKSFLAAHVGNNYKSDEILSRHDFEIKEKKCSVQYFYMEDDKKTRFTVFMAGSEFGEINKHAYSRSREIPDYEVVHIPLSRRLRSWIPFNLD